MIHRESSVSKGFREPDSLSCPSLHVKSARLTGNSLAHIEVIIVAQTHVSKNNNGESRGKRGEDAVFNLTSSKDIPIRDERYDMDAGLERFQKETGINFLDAIRNKRTIVKKLVDGSDHQDTDDDELENQRIYGPFQERLIRESD